MAALVAIVLGISGSLMLNREATRADSATIRIERTSDAVTVGDFVALHR